MPEQESRLETLAGLSHATTTCSQAEIYGPLILQEMWQKDPREVFKRLYETLKAKAQDIDAYFSRFSGTPEALNYGVVLKTVIVPHYSEVEQIMMHCEDGPINPVPAALHMAMLIGAYNNLEFLKRSAELKSASSQGQGSSR